MSGAAAAAPEFRDDRGVTVALAASPRRIVSLLPPLTETVCTLGPAIGASAQIGR